MEKTTKQKIAETEMKLQRLKEKERKERTRELIILGGAVRSYIRNHANTAEKQALLQSLLSSATKQDRDIIEQAFKG